MAVLLVLHGAENVQQTHFVLPDTVVDGAGMAAQIPALHGAQPLCPKTLNAHIPYIFHEPGLDLGTVAFIVCGQQVLQQRSHILHDRQSAQTPEGPLVIGLIYVLQQKSSAESVAYFMLSLIPAKFSVAVLFVVACFVSTAMGTSVGTITLIAPIAAAVSDASGFDLALCIGSVMGGAMFGDNLSFISDTTIAACNGQGCPMKDKFRENFWIAFPAALVTLGLILVLSLRTDLGGAVNHEYHLIQMVPYILVLIGGIIGINVFLVLLIGIFSGIVIMLATGQTSFVDLISSMGSGISGMFETCMVAVLVAALCALIREYGGFEALLSVIRRIFRGRKGGQFGMGLLVAAMDIATANNTVAIVMANPIAVEMSEEYGITHSKAASLLDTFSCISQGAIPYGAQMLVALSAIHEMGHDLSAFDVIPNLFYPGLLLVSSLLFIFVIPQKK